MQRSLEERLEKKAFKMSIILGLMHLDPQGRSRAIDELAGRELTIPYSHKKTLTRATIYRWLKEYRATLDPGAALLQKPRRDRGSFRTLTEPQRTALLRWRYDNPYRTAEDLRQELLAHATTGQEPVPGEATIARFLRSVGLDRRAMILEREAEETGRPVKTARLAFEAPYPQHIWQADTKGPRLMVRDPQHPEGLLEARLIVCMDDNSRYVTGARYVIAENEEWVMAIFRSAIATYGVPDILYVDLGSPYMGHSLLRAAALVGCHVLHTPRGDAPAKGKIEKQMQPFNEKLESELALLESPPSLDEANEYLAAFISQHYHVRVHSSTGERPIDRYASFPEECRRFVSERTLAMIFLPCATSKVTKTCLIRLHNTQYLVPDPRLAGQRVDVRYDPLDESRALVFFKDEFRGEASVHNNTADFLGRQAELARMESALRSARKSEIPPAEAVPYYSFLERRLAAYRMERESFSQDLNAELAALREQKGMVKAALAGRTSEGPDIDAQSHLFGPQEFAHLLSLGGGQVDDPVPADGHQPRPRELYRAIATALGANPSWFGADALKIIDLLTQSYLESHRPNLLVIDESHLLLPAALNGLRLLSNIQEKREPLVSLVLFGQPQLAATLKLPAMTPLVQRVAVWVTLEGMSAEETSAYIDWQLKTAGAEDPERIIPVGVKNGIHRRAHGIARLVNRIAWECLNQACLDGAHMVTEELLQEVCKTLEPQLT